MRAARISHVRSACEVGIGCARATNVYLVITGPSVLSTPAGVFTKDYFAFWIFIAVIWALVASFIIIALPIWESKAVHKSNFAALLPTAQLGSPRHRRGASSMA